MKEYKQIAGGGASPAPGIPRYEKGGLLMPADNTQATADSTKTRKRLWMLLVAVICVFAAAQTLSVITREKPFLDRLQFGAVGLETSITTIDETGAEVPAPEGGELGTGSVHMERIVRVKNTGNHALFIRVKLRFECIDAAGTPRPADDLVSYDVGNDAWIQRNPSDGYLYLTAALEPGEISEPAVTGVDVDTAAAIARHGEGCTYRLVADGYGVQSENQKSDDVLEAEGWPA